jgi:hypothetical protein
MQPVPGRHAIADSEVVDDLLDHVLLCAASSAPRVGAPDLFIALPLGATKNTFDMLPQMQMTPSSSHSSDLRSTKSRATWGSGMKNSTNLNPLRPSSSSDENPGLSTNQA